MLAGLGDGRVACPIGSVDPAPTKKQIRDVALSVVVGRSVQNILSHVHGDPACHVHRQTAASELVPEDKLVTTGVRYRNACDSCYAG